ncbi:hypothetical protein BGZ68_002598 [Mortierella alpina]|nr:hypothetical protein BGZ68_002598 [Mortierella alpina]
MLVGYISRTELRYAVDEARKRNLPGNTPAGNVVPILENTPAFIEFRSWMDQVIVLLPETEKSTTDIIELEKKIGSGAQAEIFKAKCGLDDVVVKRFLDSTSTKQEVDIIKDLTHKHIVQFYHVHQDMIVMEYVEKGSLADAIKEGILESWGVKTQIAKGISLGLAYLQYEDIIHCDIKSSNILLTEYNEARICDFGHAIMIGEAGRGGTLQWMAPELLHDPPRHTSKSDVYALGMVMWEMASESTQPYRGHTPDGVMYCILNGILEEYPDDTPKAYAACVQMCWMVCPDERPAAMDLLPDVVQPPIRHVGAEQQQWRKAMDIREKAHYLNALKQFFSASESVEFMDIIRSDGIHPDNDKTMDWFDSSAGGQESAKAMVKMGAMYYSGRNVEKDYGKALEWFLAASEAGVVVAMLKISQMYQHGRGMEQDDNEAALWSLKAKEAVNEQGKLNNLIIHHDSGVSEHHGRTMEWFDNAAGVRSATAMYNIGHMYQVGETLEKDYSKALEWYFKASDAGNVTAMVNIGSIYEEGVGVEKNYGKAMEWFGKASDAGNAEAMGCVGYMYQHSQGVEQDSSMAMEWYLKASEAGNADAMTNIGIMYHYGQGVELDYGKAMEWYLKASDYGRAAAMVNIHLLYRFGLGVKQDFDKALEWDDKARMVLNTTEK